MRTGPGVYRVDALAVGLPAASRRLSAGRGAKGCRYYGWSHVALPRATDIHHCLVIHRNRSTGELAFYRCSARQPTALQIFVTIAGRRWRIEESFQPRRPESA